MKRTGRPTSASQRLCHTTDEYSPVVQLLHFIARLGPLAGGLQQNSSMPTRNIIVVGASAGGVEALTTLVSGFPPNFEATIFIVLHVPPEGPSVLPAILRRRCALHAVHPQSGDPILPGMIYVAPPGYHL